MVSSFLFGGCFGSGGNTNFEGDGEISRLNSPALLGTDGWRVNFEEIPLSKKYSATYSFQGLPKEGDLKHYVAYFYVPASVDAHSLRDAQLEMILYMNGTQISSFKSRLEKWICFSFTSSSEKADQGDGLEKNYYNLDLRIPAIPENQYTLRINYSPPEKLSSEESGYIYLSLGGFK